MKAKKKAVLMISLGTPDSPGWLDVASYLKQFLVMQESLIYRRFLGSYSLIS